MSEATAQAAELARGQVEELCGLLRQAIRGSDSTAKAVSVELGMAPAYLSRVFKGHHALKVKHVFGILAALGEDPADFFAQHYPLTVRLPPRREEPEAEEASEEPPHEASQEAALAEGRWRWPATDPQEMVERTRRLLAAVLDRKDVKRRAVDRALGLGKEDRLGRALRGEADLLALHVFGALAVAGVPPAVFFAELLTPRRKGYEEVLDLLQKVVSEAAAGLRRKASPPEADDGGEVPKD